jgi:hypothetical protein
VAAVTHAAIALGLSCARGSSGRGFEIQDSDVLRFAATATSNRRFLARYFLRYGYSGIFEKRFISCTSGSGMNPSLSAKISL